MYLSMGIYLKISLSEKKRIRLNKEKKTIVKESKIQPSRLEMNGFIILIISDIILITIRTTHVK